MLFSARTREAIRGSSCSKRQLLASLGVVALCLLVTQGLSPNVASGDPGSLNEPGIVEAGSGVGMSGNFPNGPSTVSGDGEVCGLAGSIPCNENRKCRGKLQCSISCSDCYKSNPMAVKGTCHKFPPK